MLSKIFKKYLEWQFYLPDDFSVDHQVHVDLGSGGRIRNPFNSNRVVGSDYKLPRDQKESGNFLICDLTKSIPLESASISSFSAFDVIEHIPRWERMSSGKIRFPFINFMNEVNRCLKPDGIFIAVTPAFPKSSVFQDPTHVNFITQDTVRYFTEEGWASNLEYEYAGNFKLVKQSWVYSQNVFDGFCIKPGSRIKKWIFLFDRLLTIVFNKYVRRNQPTHLLWVLQKTKEV
jgi:SAM-dependent methyltransferase